jgi:hypothetical protein
MDEDGVLKDTLRKVNDFVDDDLLSCFLCKTPRRHKRARPPLFGEDAFC